MLRCTKMSLALMTGKNTMGSAEQILWAGRGKIRLGFRFCGLNIC